MQTSHHAWRDEYAVKRIDFVLKQNYTRFTIYSKYNYSLRKYRKLRHDMRSKLRVTWVTSNHAADRLDDLQRMQLDKVIELNMHN